MAPADLPGPGRSAYDLLVSIGAPHGIRALIVMGSNIVVSAPDAREIEQRLKALDFLVVVDFFLSETAQLADVVLPSAQWAEEDGTMTNLEGRVILRRRVFDPPAGVRTDVDMLCALAARFGAGHRFVPTAARRCSTSSGAPAPAALADYSGMTYERIERGRRRLLAVPGGRPSRARRGCLPIAFRRRAAAPGFTPSATSRRRKSATTTTRCS